ncbi:hypothetical protein QQF64_005008 [Cirrhinus molitorella]|uniref:Uncharacterized protein n=1 Tax=Cirrhinus molitorella TaxID=172907 RepID=A0ABR3MHY4_9TELE
MSISILSGIIPSLLAFSGYMWFRESPQGIFCFEPTFLFIERKRRRNEMAAMEVWLEARTAHLLAGWHVVMPVASSALQFSSLMFDALKASFSSRCEPAHQICYITHYA